MLEFFHFILSQLSNCIRAFKMRCSIKEREFLKRFKKKKKKKKKKETKEIKQEHQQIIQ